MTPLKFHTLNSWKASILIGVSITIIGHILTYLIFHESLNKLFFKSLLFVGLIIIILIYIFNSIYYYINKKRKVFIGRVFVKGAIFTIQVFLILEVFFKSIDYIARGELKCWVWENSYSCPLLKYIFTDTIGQILFLALLTWFFIIPLCYLLVLIYESIKTLINK